MCENVRINLLGSVGEMSTEIVDQFPILAPSMELFWVDLWLCIWSVWQNVRMRDTSVMNDKTCYLELEISLELFYELWAMDLNILLIPRITSQFRWVELTCFVSCLMEYIWVEDTAIWI